METITTHISSYTKARDFSNEQLRALLKEIWEISNLDVPRKAKHSPDMKLLFQLEKTSWNYWADQFANVRRAIEIEILHRVRTDKF